MTEIAEPTRLVGDVVLPRPGTWAIDPGHAEVGFEGRHFLLTRVRGRFTGVSGAVRIADDPNDSTVSVTIDMTTVDSGDDTRDNHLRSSDLFDIAAHPTATFVSTAVDWQGGTGRMTGTLTIKGVSRSVVLATEYLGYVRDPWGADRVVFSARGRINREDWGVSWNMPLAKGGLLVSREIDLVIEVELIHQPA